MNSELLLAPSKTISRDLETNGVCSHRPSFAIAIYVWISILPQNFLGRI